jgi:hypothetical protein
MYRYCVLVYCVGLLLGVISLGDFPERAGDPGESILTGSILSSLDCHEMGT